MVSNDGKTKTLASSQNAGFLDRWSRRKAKARTAEPVPKPAPEPEDTDRDELATALDETGEQPFDVKSLPDIESLGPGSDFSVFMQAGVPSELKTKALRKLWRVKSELANLDGLIDYGEDLTGSFKVVDHLKTAYEVGRGFLREDQKSLDDLEDAVTDTDKVIADETGADDATVPVETAKPASPDDGQKDARDVASTARNPNDPKEA